MRTDTPVAIQRSDYRPAAWQIPATELWFDLHPTATRVRSRLTLQRQRDEPLVLDGVGLALEAIQVDGEPWPADQFELSDTHLTLHGLPSQCVLALECTINPSANTALEGLYLSSGNYCTQCEAEGFRKITWYPDRPDVLSVFTVNLGADASACPVLLSNGNFVVGNAGPNGLSDPKAVKATSQDSNTTQRKAKTTARWHDPHPKPCYLFALVGGQLASLEERFVTASGREVALSIHVEPHNLNQCGFAMQALKRAMRWDEQVYGLEYDLERFMIVAVDDFNMGAMENKGLNIFNSKYVLASPETATDADYLGVEAVIAHEYFHNWTGNRVTCRDWFQLSLKEGLTVFRDQCFTADLHSATVKRIDDVRLLRARQFPEDAGPMAHPIRPDSYIEINNFYTLTVYEKGAEVIRMLHGLLGEARWQAGMREYFCRHDGQAVTCEDFVMAMEAASGVDLAQFRRWYEQAGTPQVRVTDHYDPEARRYTLTLTQSCPDTPGQRDKPPLHIPLRIGLLGTDGRALAAGPDGDDTLLFDLTGKQQSVSFDDMDQRPVPSLLRGFSAPVTVHYDHDEAALTLLMAHDVDAFNRWEAGQRLATRLIERQLEQPERDPGEGYIRALEQILHDPALEPAFQAEMLSLPTLATLAVARDRIDMPALHAARLGVQQGLAAALYEPLLACVQQSVMAHDEPLHPAATGQRRLANQALALLGTLPAERWQAVADLRYARAGNMTDRVAALQVLCMGSEQQRDQALADFHARYSDELLVMDKWFAIQASIPQVQTLERVGQLLEHPGFDVRNPNRVRALLSTFARNNPLAFHERQGRGYTLLAGQVLRLNAINPQGAAGLVGAFNGWRRHAEPWSGLMHEQLQRIAASPALSSDVFELVQRALADSAIS